MHEQIKTLEQQVQEIFDQVKANAKRIKELGNWPAWINEQDSLPGRVPQPGDTNASGFDAGIACALDLIPRDKQQLSATLHAAYKPEVVAQIRREMQDLKVGDETCWWLACCHFCMEGGIDQTKFLEQIASFKRLIQDKEKMLRVAQEKYAEMLKLFYFIPELGPDVAYGERDGCMQGAYVGGHSFAVEYSPQHGIYFIGTYLPSLGLEDFSWSAEVDAKGRTKSGPVHGSSQYVKCADMQELRRALVSVKEKLLK